MHFTHLFIKHHSLLSTLRILGGRSKYILLQNTKELHTNDYLKIEIYVYTNYLDLAKHHSFSLFVYNVYHILVVNITKCLQNFESPIYGTAI